MVNEQPTLSYDGAAMLVNLHKNTVRRMVRDKLLTPYIRPGSHGHYFKPTDVKKANEKRLRLLQQFKPTRPRQYKKKPKGLSGMSANP